jgi:hypothetical protein
MPTLPTAGRPRKVQEGAIRIPQLERMNFFMDDSQIPFYLLVDLP